MGKELYLSKGKNGILRATIQEKGGGEKSVDGKGVKGREKKSKKKRNWKEKQGGGVKEFP